MPVDIICETPRLTLRKIQESDAKDLLKILGDPEVMRFSVHDPETMEGVKKFLNATFRRYESDGVAQWAVVRKEDDAFIGGCGISVQNVDGKKEYEIGYRFALPYWGMGYASEAAKACRDYGQSVLGLKRLV